MENELTKAKEDPRPAIYLRSAIGGEDGESAIADQRKRCMEYLTRSGAGNPEDVLEFSDFGSGLRGDHPGLRNLLAAAEAGAVDRIIVSRLDCFGRNHRLVARALKALLAASVRIQSTDGVLDSETAMGKACIQLLSAFA